MLASHLATEEYPDGREIILVANDITHMSGSLSPKEDAVYRAAFDFSVREGLPCVTSAPTVGHALVWTRLSRRRSVSRGKILRNPLEVSSVPQRGRLRDAGR